jgi:enoyl-CoA hydratase/carnithine racemase
MSADAVILMQHGPLATLTLNRPRVLNAFNTDLLVDLEAALDALSTRTELRVLVIRGAGRAFSAGLDLDMRARGVTSDFFARTERVRARIEGLAAISIAAVQGYCLGGGLQLAIACDLRVASSDAQFGLPAVLEGVFPGLATVRLPRLIGLGRARRLILSGELVGAAAALDIGLIDHVTAASTFDTELIALVEQYTRVPASAAAASRYLMQRAFDTPLDTLAAELPALMAACLASADAAQAQLAWAARRADRARGAAAVR